MASAVANEWTKEMCIELVRQYRARPTLWDSKDPLFYKQALKPRAWQEIAQALNMPMQSCKHKLGVLLSSFRREKANIIHSIQEGEPTYKSTWFAFKELAFLMDKANERKRQKRGILDFENDDISGEPSVNNVILDHYLNIEASKKRRRLTTKPNASEVPAMSNELSSENKTQEAMLLTTSPLSIPGPSISETEEEIKSFTNFIASKMKKYAETTKNAVQQAICEVIFKADQGFYENTYFGYNTQTVIVESSENKSQIQIKKVEQVTEEDDDIIIKQDYSVGYYDSD